MNDAHMDVSLTKPGGVYAHDLYDEYGNVVLTAYNEFTEGMKKHLLAENITRLYYKPAKKTAPGDRRLQRSTGGCIGKDQGGVLENSRDLLDFVRDNMNYSPEKRLTKDRIDKSRALVKKIMEEIDENKEGEFNPFIKLRSLEEYDYLHSTNVSILSALLASKLEFSRDIRAAMGLGGLFHDIGKSSIAKDILNKAKLSDEEFDIVKEHPHVGYKYVENNIHMQDLEKRIVLLHHERADGNGYPFGMDMEHVSQKIPREVRLVALCDVFSAVVAHKPYGVSRTPGEALRLMLNLVYAPYKNRYHFLPGDFRDFIRALGMALNGSDFFIQPGDLVRLDSGEVAVVEEMNRLFPLNPRVRVVTTMDKQPLKRQVQVDLLNNYSALCGKCF